jgi:hypothetical protein
VSDGIRKRGKSRIKLTHVAETFEPVEQMRVAEYIEHAYQFISWETLCKVWNPKANSILNMSRQPFAEKIIQISNVPVSDERIETGPEHVFV